MMIFRNLPAILNSRRGLPSYLYPGLRDIPAISGYACLDNNSSCSQYFGSTCMHEPNKVNGSKILVFHLLSSRVFPTISDNEFGVGSRYKLKAWRSPVRNLNPPRKFILTCYYAQIVPNCSSSFFSVFLTLSSP